MWDIPVNAVFCDIRFSYVSSGLVMCGWCHGECLCRVFLVQFLYCAARGKGIKYLDLSPTGAKSSSTKIHWRCIEISEDNPFRCSRSSHSQLLHPNRNKSMCQSSQSNPTKVAQLITIRPRKDERDENNLLSVCGNG
jgi:hypothetical protein